MFKGMIAAATAVALSATPVMAAGSPANALSLRAAASVQDENDLAGGTGGILAALIGLGVAALVVIAVTDDDNDEELPVSA